MWNKCENNVKICEQNAKHVKHIFGTCILKNVKNAFQQCEDMWKCEKSLNKCGNMLKNRKLHVLILFLFWTNNSLRSLWTYWHESLNMNICLCGILMFKFNILKFKNGTWKKNLYLEKRNNGAKKQELFNCLLLPFFTCFPCYSHFFTCLKRMFFTFFSKRISKPLFSACFFTFFTIMWRNVKKRKDILNMRLETMKNAFWKCTWKNVKKCEKNIWTSSWEGGALIFWGRVLLQLLCCLPNFCRLKIPGEQFKSIGSGLCRSQTCLYNISYL